MALLQTTCPWRQVQLARTGEVYQLYERFGTAEDRCRIRSSRTAPSFEDAVAVHRVIAAIEKAAESGSRTVLT